MALAYLGYLQERKTAETRRKYVPCLPGTCGGRQLRAGGVMALTYLGHAEEDSFDHEKSGSCLPGT
jgi:hypothetical protein